MAAQLVCPRQGRRKELRPLRPLSMPNARIDDAYWGKYHGLMPPMFPMLSHASCFLSVLAGFKQTTFEALAVLVLMVESR